MQDTRAFTAAVGSAKPLRCVCIAIRVTVFAIIIATVCPAAIRNVYSRASGSKSTDRWLFLTAQSSSGGVAKFYN